MSFLASGVELWKWVWSLAAGGKWQKTSWRSMMYGEKIPPHWSPTPVWLPDTYNVPGPYTERNPTLFLSSPLSRPPSSLCLSRYEKINRELQIHLLLLFPSPFRPTEIHIYANMLHLFPPQPRMGDGSQARINDIALAVMFATFH